MQPVLGTTALIFGPLNSVIRPRWLGESHSGQRKPDGRQPFPLLFGSCILMDPEECKLVLRAREGDREALTQLVGILRVPLFSLAYAELRHYEDAQDAVAAALLRICLHIHELKQSERVRPWMNSIVRNEVRRLLHSRRPETTVVAWEEAQLHVAEPLPSLLRLDIEQVLERLSKDHARALALFYIAGLPIREIARRVGRPEGTVKFWLHQGRQQLAQHMEGYAPMMTSQTERWTASIVSTELDANLLSRMVDALKAGGWEAVNIVRDFEAAGRLEQTGEGDSREFHLPTPLRESRCIILDEWIGGRSAFELLPLLSAAAERKDTAIFLLADATPERPSLSDITVHAAYAAGVDILLTKPFQIADFERFGKHLRTSLAQKP